MGVDRKDDTQLTFDSEVEESVQSARAFVTGPLAEDLPGDSRRGQRFRANIRDHVDSARVSAKVVTREGRVSERVS